ncbi:MAG: hypothetical protein ACYC35_05540 [Pirellulales bacterium]
MIRYLAVCLLLASTAGCAIFPEISHQPTVHNPFPQLSKVAVAPFFNLSTEATVDGRQFALAYFNELQLVPGFEVVPIGVVENAMRTYNLSLNNPDDARRLAEVLGVDAVVVGAVTDFTPYYPPRCGLQIEWYAANPGFHPIPPGYGLPWGTPEEEQIPGPLIFEAEMALARAQLKTQTPAYQASAEELPAAGSTPKGKTPAEADPKASGATAETQASHVDPIASDATTGATKEASPAAGALPTNWPDPKGFIPPAPKATPPKCAPSREPVLRHTKTYNGHDADFTTALSSYVYFRDDARFGGWQSYLQRSDDFIRFCCHMHIYEMLSARGGAGETRVVWRWPTSR